MVATATHAANLPSAMTARRRAVRRDARGRFTRAPSVGLIAEPVRRASLFVTTEMADFVKAGGLGDVAAALPRTLRRDYDVRVLIPGYPAVVARIGPMDIVGRIAPRGNMPACSIGLSLRPDGLPVYVLLCDALFNRPGTPYVDESGHEWQDNALRFGALSNAAAEIACGRAALDWQPDLLHLNDWPCALAAAYLRWSHARVPCLLTIHNLAYQGLFPYSVAEALGIPAGGLADLEFFGQMSFLRGGIVHADHINTVSDSYARQITFPAMGCGLDTLLARRAANGALSGILNGIDDSWDPRTDAHLESHFSVNNAEGKHLNAQRVRREFGLPTGTGPLFAVVSRLVHQKGLDLICDVTPQIVAAGGQIVIIGGGDPLMEDTVRALGRRFPAHVGAFIGFEERLARRMFAGADFLLMPSRFEPCGLSQMYAQRFGCLPIAHATGGLLDTVDDGVTGFLFDGATADGLRRCLQRAFLTFRRPQLLAAMRRAAMLRPSGWDVAGRKYGALYESAGTVAA